MGLYGEGRSDERFLPVVVQRTAERVVEGANADVEVSPVLALGADVRGSTTRARADCIAEAARLARHLDVLVVHTDADRRTRDRALRERVEPGMALVQELRAGGEALCGTLVPVVPVRMVEAWMCADVEGLLAALPVERAVAAELLPAASAEVERLADPKDVLRRLVERSALRARRRRAGVPQERLGTAICLEVLDQVPAYAAFRDDLRRALAHLAMVT
jgi:hypothetical protein